MAKRRSSDQKGMSMVFGILIVLLGIGFLVGVIMTHKPIRGLSLSPVSVKSSSGGSTNSSSVNSPGADKTAGSDKAPASTQAATAEAPSPGSSAVAIDPADKAAGVPPIPVTPSIPTFGQ